MKKTLKKVTCGIISLVMALTCLAACGGNGDSNDNSNNSNNSIFGAKDNNPAPNIPEAPVADFEYAYDAETQGIKITKYIGTPVKVRIPDKIEGEPVTRIGRSAFAEIGIMSVYIPNTVTMIDDKAFYICANLTTSIVIPDGVTKIGESAFGGCSGLTSIVIPDSVTIGYGAFFNCDSLPYEAKQKILTINPKAFDF